MLMLVGGVAEAGPREDLASSDQAKRDAAAEKLRATWKPAPRTKWKKVATIKKGMTKPAILARLKPYKWTPGIGASGGGSTQESYQLDDSWVLIVWYNDRVTPMTAFKHELAENMVNIWVEPPKTFTGVWSTYFPNGQKSHVMTYKDGVHDGEEIGFFKSGKVTHRGSYAAGKQVGTWTWYKEDGTVGSTQKY